VVNIVYRVVAIVECNKPHIKERVVVDPLSLGSGFIISPEGHILTAAHVAAVEEEIEDQIEKILIRLFEEKGYQSCNALVQELTIKAFIEDKDVLPAKLIRFDKDADVALLKVDATNLKWIPLGDSEKLGYGEEVWALGYPVQIAGEGFTAVSCIVHGFRQRGLVKVIQLKGDVYPGNSGGPLINSKGEAVGIIVERWFYLLEPEFSIAISINTAKQIIPPSVTYNMTYYNETYTQQPSYKISVVDFYIAPSVARVNKAVTVVFVIENSGTRTLTGVEARIILPPGLSLSTGQLLTVYLGTLPPHESREVSWVIIGKEAGEYTIGVRVTTAQGVETTKEGKITVTP